MSWSWAMPLMLTREAVAALKSLQIRDIYGILNRKR